MTTIIIASHEQEEQVKSRPEFIPYDAETYDGPFILNPQVIGQIVELEAECFGQLPGQVIFTTKKLKSGEFWKIG
jgi:hypothetical protein